MRIFHSFARRTALFAFLAALAVPAFFLFASPAARGDETPAAETETAKLPWRTNVEEAKAEAKQAGKDLFINFTGSDWCGWCKRLDAEVFSKPEFIEAAPKEFVFLFLDSPQSEELKAKVVDPELNKKLFDLYEAEGYPTIMLTTADGTPYGRTGYQQGGPEAYLEHLAELREGGAKVKAILGHKDSATVEQLTDAFPVLVNNNLLGHPAYDWVLEAAEKADPTGELGLKELVDQERQRRLAAKEQADLMALLPHSRTEKPDWAKVYEFFKDVKYMEGAMYLNIAFTLADWLMSDEQKRPEEAKALLEKAGQDELAKTHPRAKEVLAELLAKAEAQIKGENATGDDDDKGGADDGDDDGDDDNGDDDGGDDDDDDGGR